MSLPILCWDTNDGKRSELFAIHMMNQDRDQSSIVSKYPSSGKSYVLQFQHKKAKRQILRSKPMNLAQPPRQQKEGNPQPGNPPLKSYQWMVHFLFSKSLLI